MLIAAYFSGCKLPQTVLEPSGFTGKAVIEAAKDSSEPLTVLSVTGGLCLVAGMILFVITGGRKGWYPVIGGVILVILNYMVARYDDYIFYPLVICTALISGAWTYSVVKQILIERKPQ